jgi:hypothetical protein
MPATDNRFPITYDGVDPATILPSWNPYQGKPIKKISASSDLSRIVIQSAADEFPYTDSYIATTRLYRIGGAGTALSTGFAKKLSGDASISISHQGPFCPIEYVDYAYTYYRFTSNGYYQAGGPFASLRKGSMIELDDVFYSIYLKDYENYEGIYTALSTAGANSRWNLGLVVASNNRLPQISFTGTYPAFTPGPHTTRTYANSNFSGLQFIWTRPDTTNTFQSTGAMWSVDSLVLASPTTRLGGIEGWHFTPSIKTPLYFKYASNGQGFVVNPGASASHTISATGAGLSEATVSGINFIPGGDQLIDMGCVYAAPYCPDTSFYLAKLNGASYDQEQLAITQSNQPHNGSNIISTAKAIALSPDGKYLIASGTSEKPSDFRAIAGLERVYIFKNIFSGGIFSWRNAFLANGAVPTSAQTASTIGGIIYSSGQDTLWDRIRLTTASNHTEAIQLSSTLAYQRVNDNFNSVAINNNGGWFVSGNFGWTSRSKMITAQSPTSIIEAEFSVACPSAPNACSESVAGLTAATPDPGTEYGGAGSPTIAIAVSNNGLIVKANRAVSRNYKRIGIVGVSGGDTITLAQPHGLTPKGAISSSKGEYYNYAGFDIDNGGTMPIGALKARGYLIEPTDSTSVKIYSEVSITSTGTSAYLIIYDADYNRFGYLGFEEKPSRKKSNFNIASYQESAYATVTIDGIQVIPSSQVTLENARYGAFGSCVAVDADGETVAVASPSEGYSETSGDQPPCEGAVYLYKKLATEGGGGQWEQVNRITVPRFMGYAEGDLGDSPHIQFGCALQFINNYLLIGSRQGVYVYELNITLAAQLAQKTTIVAGLSFSTPLEFSSSSTTSTRIGGVLQGASIELAETVAGTTRMAEQFEVQRGVDVNTSVSMASFVSANLTIATKVSFGSTKLSQKTELSSSMTFATYSTSVAISGATSLGVIVTGGAGIQCGISANGSYSASITSFVPISSPLDSYLEIDVSDTLFRINPYLIESASITATGILADLTFTKIELAAVLNKSTSIRASSAKLITLGTTDSRASNIFEAGKGSPGSISGLSQRWVKRSDLQNSDLTTSVEWVEGEPPQLD